MSWKSNAVRAWAMLAAVASFAGALGGCNTKIQSGSGGGFVPSPTPSPTPSFSPGPCATENPDPNLVVVGMEAGFVVTKVATYGYIGGYAVIDPNFESPPPTTAEVINTTVSGAPITSNNTLQFANVEPLGTVVHSAYGFTTSGFPRRFVFPSPVPSPSATAISASTNWFTGLIATNSATYCFSQTFTLKPGTYYFGDYNYYKISTARDVLIVGTPTP